MPNLNVAFVSLFQCDGPRSTVSTSASFRGTIVVPFFPNETTFEQFYSGLEHRLNKYAQAHAIGCDDRSSATSKAKSQKEQRRRRLPQKRSSSLHPLSSYFCSFCNDQCNVDCVHEAPRNLTSVSLCHDDMAYHDAGVMRGSADASAGSPVCGIVTSYPTVHVGFIRKRMSLRSRESDEAHLRRSWDGLGRGDGLAPLDESEAVLLPRDAGATLPDECMYCNLIFWTKVVHDVLTTQCDDDVLLQPKITEDGLTHRPRSGADHCPAFVNEFMGGGVVVSLTIRGAVHSYRFSPVHTCWDMMQRVEAFESIRISRVFDRETNASVLPCETVSHFAWKFTGGRLAVEVFPFGERLPPSTISPRKVKTDIVITPVSERFATGTTTDSMAGAPTTAKKRKQRRDESCDGSSVKRRRDDDNDDFFELDHASAQSWHSRAESIAWMSSSTLLGRAIHPRAAEVVAAGEPKGSAARVESATDEIPEEGHEGVSSPVSSSSIAMSAFDELSHSSLSSSSPAATQTIEYVHAMTFDEGDDEDAS